MPTPIVQRRVGAFRQVAKPPELIQTIASTDVGAIAEAARKMQGLAVSPPRDIVNVDSISSPYFHLILYADTDGWKTVTAAKFGPPEDVRIINTRRKEQLLCLKGLHYVAANCDDAETIKDYLMYPELMFGEEWASRPNATLILDDISYFTELENEANETRIVEVGGVETEIDVKDRRQIYKASKDTMWDVVCRGVLRRPFHFIAVALAKSWMPNPNEERILPDLPPGVWKLIGSDFEFCFYIDKANHTLLTREHRTILRKNPTERKHGDPETYTKIVFAKSKIPIPLLAPGIPPLLKANEPPHLRDIWERIKAGKAVPTARKM